MGRMLSLKFEDEKFDKSRVSFVGSEVKVLIIDYIPLEALTFWRVGPFSKLALELIVVKFLVEARESSRVKDLLLLSPELALLCLDSDPYPFYWFISIDFMLFVPLLFLLKMLEAFWDLSLVLIIKLWHCIRDERIFVFGFGILRISPFSRIFGFGEGAS